MARIARFAAPSLAAALVGLLSIAPACAPSQTTPASPSSPASPDAPVGATPPAATTDDAAGHDHGGHGGHGGHDHGADGDGHSHGGHGASGHGAVVEPPAPPAPAAPTAEELAAAEVAAYQAARPVLDKYCAGCHVAGGKKAKKKSLAHFDMTTYPFKGEHADEMAHEIREVLGVDGDKPTMPMGKPGVVKGDELALIVAWADAWQAAHPAPAGEGHGGHKH